MEIAEKIRKLLALAKSSNPNEAFIAMQKANALLAEYGMTIEEVEKKNVEIKDIIVLFDNLPQSLAILFERISVWNGADMVLADNAVYFVGQWENITTTTVFCEYIIECLKKGMQNYKNKLAYLEGFTWALIEKVNAEIAKNYHTTTAEEKALMVVHHDEEIEKYIKDKFNVTRIQANRQSMKNADFQTLIAMMKGYNDGKNVSLNKQIENK